MALCLLLPGGLAAQEKPLTPVRAAYVPVATWLPAWVALDKGIFAKHGLAVTLTPIQNLSLLPGTVGRQFEFAASTPTDLIKAVAGGLDVVATAGEAIEVKSNPTTQVIVRKDSGIKTIADLKGKVDRGAHARRGDPCGDALLAEEERRRSGVDPRRRGAVSRTWATSSRPAMSTRSRRSSRSPARCSRPATSRSATRCWRRATRCCFRSGYPTATWARANRPVIKAWIDALTEAKTYMKANPARRPRDPRQVFAPAAGGRRQGAAPDLPVHHQAGRARRLDRGVEGPRAMSVPPSTRPRSW